MESATTKGEAPSCVLEWLARFFRRLIKVCVMVSLVLQNLAVGQLFPHVTPGQTLVGFDPSGLVFAAGAYIKDRHAIKMYDARSFE